MLAVDFRLFGGFSIAVGVAGDDQRNAAFIASVGLDWGPNVAETAGVQVTGKQCRRCYCQYFGGRQRNLWGRPRFCRRQLPYYVQADDRSGPVPSMLNNATWTASFAAGPSFGSCSQVDYTVWRILEYRRRRHRSILSKGFPPKINEHGRYICFRLSWKLSSRSEVADTPSDDRDRLTYERLGIVWQVGARGFGFRGRGLCELDVFSLSKVP
jgi:hypothetical protein